MLPTPVAAGSWGEQSFYQSSLWQMMPVLGQCGPRCRVSPALRPDEARGHGMPRRLLCSKPDSCKNHPADDNCTRKSGGRSLFQKFCAKGKPRVSVGRVFLTRLGAFFPALANGGRKILFLIVSRSSTFSYFVMVLFPSRLHLLLRQGRYK